MKFIIVIGLWTLFGFIHSFLISVQFTKRVKEVARKYFAFYRLAYNLLSIAIFYIFSSYTNYLDQNYIIEYNSPFDALQVLLLTLGIMLFLAAFFSYDYLHFLGIRQAVNFIMGSETIESSTSITRKGLLGIVRHPMYLAALVIIWSLDATLTGVIRNIILTLYIVVGTVLEEKKLVSDLGYEYIRYQNEVPMLLPFLNKISKKRIN